MHERCGPRLEALLLSDKQISQQEWSDRGVAEDKGMMAHAEIMQAFERLGEKICAAAGGAAPAGCSCGKQRLEWV